MLTWWLLSRMEIIRLKFKVNLCFRNLTSTRAVYKRGANVREQLVSAATSSITKQATDMRRVDGRGSRKMITLVT